MEGCDAKGGGFVVKLKWDVVDDKRRGGLLFGALSASTYRVRLEHAAPMGSLPQLAGGGVDDKLWQPATPTATKSTAGQPSDGRFP